MILVMFIWRWCPQHSHQRQISVGNEGSGATGALRQCDQREKPVTGQLQQHDNPTRPVAGQSHQINSRERSAPEEVGSHDQRQRQSAGADESM